VIGAYVAAGPVLGVVTLSASSAVSIVQLARATYERHAVAARIPRASGAHLVVPRDALALATLKWNARGGSWSMDVSHRRTGNERERWWKLASIKSYAQTALSGDEALIAARLLLPTINAAGAARRTVREAVDFLGAANSPASVFALATRSRPTQSSTPSRYNASVKLKMLPASVRLALEMAAHEETERRALEGELHLLEAAWRDAEEIAAIADDMFLPASVDAELARLKRER
jgi:hypothetical protein